ncbi:hypothetical protein JTB14_016568 [Gonioctena quinquepunctata]|nr:hypothetical protein JTB14_016568 [Gonioctena quinquepunctata]
MANYQGCTCFLKLVRNSKRESNNNNANNSTPQNIPRPANSNANRPGVSYAQATATNNDPNNLFAQLEQLTPLLKKCPQLQQLVSLKAINAINNE